MRCCHDVSNVQINTGATVLTFKASRILCSYQGTKYQIYSHKEYLQGVRDTYSWGCRQPIDSIAIKNIII